MITFLACMMELHIIMLGIDYYLNHCLTIVWHCIIVTVHGDNYFQLELIFNESLPLSLMHILLIDVNTTLVLGVIIGLITVDC